MKILVNKLFHLTGHQAAVYALVAGADGKLVYTGSSDKMIARWNIAEKKADNFAASMPTSVYQLLYDVAYNRLYVGSGVGAVHVIDLNEKKEIKNLILHPNAAIFDLIKADKFNLIITAAADGSVVAFDENNFELIARNKLCEQKIRSLCFIESSQVLLAACGDGYIRVLELPTLKVVNQFYAHDLSANKVIKHPIKDIILSGGRDAHLNIMEWPSCKIMEKIPAHNFAIYDIVFHPENSLFATASRDKNIKIWDANSLQFLYRIDKEKNEGHINSVNKLLWSKYENTLVSTGDDRSMMGWQIKMELL
ncbi:MAG: WD40 repeat domain-containing protein [Bacteroidota bacterium]